MSAGHDKLSPSGYEVGYGKPPLQTRFRKGQSGNPGGRRRGSRRRRARDLILIEAFRRVKIKEGDQVVELPAIQAVLRSQIALAAKGNGAAQRAVISLVQACEDAGGDGGTIINVVTGVPRDPDGLITRSG